MSVWKSELSDLEERGEKEREAFASLKCFTFFESSTGCNNKQCEPFPPQCPEMPRGLINSAAPGKD